MAKSLAVHGAVLAIAAVAAVTVWTRDKQPKALAHGDVTVWSGAAADVTHVGFEGKSHKVSLDAAKDAVGRYFLGVEEKDTKASAGLDAGAAPATEHTTTTFVSVGGADKLAEGLAPLKALRALGKLPADRDAEFGLAEPEGTLTVHIGSADHTLVIGAATPGGSDRYVRDPASGETFVVRGELYRDVDTPDAQLLERKLHGWEETDVKKARISAAGKSRAIARGGKDAKRFWADAASPDQNDETIGNWMAKLDRLRPQEYLAKDKEPPGKEDVVKLEYEGAAPLGWLELVKAPGASGKFDYFIKTERTRLYGKVTAALGEQVDTDVGSIVR